MTSSAAAPWPADVDRVLAGEAMPSEQAAAEDWAARHPGAPMFFGTLRDALEPEPRERLDTRALFARVVPETTRVARTVRFRTRKSWPFKRVVAAATMIAASVAIGVVGWYTRQPVSAAVSAAATSSWVTAPGERARITLPDGSRAHLAPATRLDLIHDQGITVRVTGQALFTVIPNTNLPFIVRTGHAETRVLGTEFFVRHYDTESETRVAVVNGRVAVEGMRLSESQAAPQAILGAQMVAVLDDSGRVVVTPNVSTDDFTSWTEGRLVFRQTQVTDIVNEISRAYGVEVKVADSLLAQRKLTWTVTTQDRPLQGVLESLALFLNAKVVRTDTGITLAPGRPVSLKPVQVQPSLTMEMSYGR